jgi:ABC-type Na+ efflux pump permease subunit
VKVFSIGIAIVTGLLLLSTLICGLWIKANKVTEASSLNFHMNIGIASVIFGIATVILLIKLQ